MNMFSIQPMEQSRKIVNIKVVGVGGGGGNAVDNMFRNSADIKDKGVEFYDINTDEQVLRKRGVSQTIQIGVELTRGLGAGGKPEVGQQSALEDISAIENALKGADMVFVAVGMGGGTGTGAGPVVAKVAKEQGALTVGVVTKPFRFEGKPRMRNAEQGIEELSQYVDSLIVIPNEKLISLGKNVSMPQALNAANDVLSNCVLGIANMIISDGGSTGNDINVDFADVKNVMSDKGIAMIGTGFAEGDVGEGRAEAAMEAAISSPLLENVDITGATGMLININAGTDFAIGEVYAMMDLIEGRTSEDCNRIFGCNYYPEMDGKVNVTVVATGIGQQEEAPKNSPFFPPHGNPPTYQQGGFQSGQQGGGYQGQPPFGNTGFQQQQTQPVVQKTQSVDNRQIFDPNSIPGFLRKG